MNTTIEPILITKRDAAALCGIGVSTLERYRSCGWFPPPVRVAGTALRWRVADLRAWIDAGCPRELARFAPDN